MPDYHGNCDFVNYTSCNGLSCRAQSERFGTQIYSETVNSVDLSKRPFKLETDEKEIEADCLIVATGVYFLQKFQKRQNFMKTM